MRWAPSGTTKEGGHLGPSSGSPPLRGVRRMRAIYYGSTIIFRLPFCLTQPIAATSRSLMRSRRSLRNHPLRDHAARSLTSQHPRENDSLPNLMSAPHPSMNTIAIVRLRQIPASYRPPRNKSVGADRQSYQNVSRETFLSDRASKPDMMLPIGALKGFAQAATDAPSHSANWGESWKDRFHYNDPHRANLPASLRPL